MRSTERPRTSKLPRARCLPGLAQHKAVYCVPPTSQVHFGECFNLRRAFRPTFRLRRTGSQPRARERPVVPRLRSTSSPRLGYFIDSHRRGLSGDLAKVESGNRTAMLPVCPQTYPVRPESRRNGSHELACPEPESFWEDSVTQRPQHSGAIVMSSQIGRVLVHRAFNHEIGIRLSNPI